MKLLATLRHPHPAEARSGGRDANTAADDAPRQAFDGVLAKVTTTQAQPNAQALRTQVPNQAALSRNTAAAAGTDHAAADVDMGDASSSSSKQVASDDGDGSDEAVGKLLRRLKSSDGGDGSNPKTGSTARGPDLSLVPGFAANPSAALRTGDRPDAAKKTDVDQTSATQAADVAGAAGRGPSGVDPRAQSPLVLGVSVSTHMAPTKSDEAPARTSDDLQPTQSADGPSTTAAASDGAESSGHDDNPSGDGKPAAALENKLEASATATAGTVALQAPVQGIAAAVAKLATQAAAAAAAPENSKGVSTAPAHTVTLQMSPGDLGTVEIRLHLSGQALDLQLTVSEQRTLGLVSRERDTLKKALETQHYELNSLVIQDGSATAPSGGPHVAKHEPSGDAPAERQSGGRDDSGARAGRERRQDQTAERSARSSSSSRADSPLRSRVVDGRSLFI